MATNDRELLTEALAFVQTAMMDGRVSMQTLALFESRLVGHLSTSAAEPKRDLCERLVEAVKDSNHVSVILRVFDSGYIDLLDGGIADRCADRTLARFADEATDDAIIAAVKGVR